MYIQVLYSILPMKKKSKVPRKIPVAQRDIFKLVILFNQQPADRLITWLIIAGQLCLLAGHSYPVLSPFLIKNVLLWVRVCFQMVWHQVPFKHLPDWMRSD